MIENTSNRDPLLLLATLMGNTGRGIEEMEAAGQQQLVHSDRLPTKARPSDAAFEALGFTFGEADKRDDLFRPATLPQGWAREASDHSMWSYIVDELGRHRVSVFYKAAFYDRDAFMHINTQFRYLRDLLYENGTPVLDDEWLTREVAVRELEAIRDEELRQADEAEAWAAKPGQDKPFWSDQAKQHRTDAAKATRAIEAVSR